MTEQEQEPIEDYVTPTPVKQLSDVYEFPEDFEDALDGSGVEDSAVDSETATETDSDEVEAVAAEPEPEDSEDSSEESDSASEATASDEGLILGDLEEFIDPDFAKKVEKAFSDQAVRIKELEALVEESTTKSANGMFDGLSPEHEAVFGGDTATKSQQKNRSRIREAVQILKAGYKARKKKSPSPKEIFDRAVRSEFPDISIEATQKQFGNKVKTRESQILSRPTARSGETLSPSVRAARKVHQMLNDFGTDL